MDDDRLLTTEELASYLQRPVRTIYQWNYSGDGPPLIKIGRTARYRWGDVKKWLREHYVDRQIA